ATEALDVGGHAHFLVRCCRPMTGTCVDADRAAPSEPGPRRREEIEVWSGIRSRVPWPWPPRIPHRTGCPVRGAARSSRARPSAGSRTRRPGAGPGRVPCPAPAAERPLLLVGLGLRLLGILLL